MTCGSPTAKVHRAPRSRKHRPKRRSSRRDSNNSSSSVHSGQRRSRNVCRRHQDFSRYRDSCRFRKRDSRVSMMEPTKDWLCNNISNLFRSGKPLLT